MPETMKYPVPKLVELFAVFRADTQTKSLVLFRLNYLQVLSKIPIFEHYRYQGLQRAQYYIVARHPDSDEESLTRETRHALEKYFTAHKYHILVKVKVDQFYDLLVAIEAVGEYKFLNLMEVANREVSFCLV